MKGFVGSAVVVATAGTLCAATATPPAEIVAVATDTGVVAILDKADPSKVFATFQPFRSQNPVSVAVGDVNGDGLDDVVAACDGSVRVLSSGGASLRSFSAFPGFTGGVTVAAGDVNGDGFADIVTGAGAGTAGGHVKVFDGVSGALHFSFFSQPTQFTGGVFVATGDLNGDGLADLVVGAGPGGGSHVKVYDGSNLALHGSFLAYGSTFQGGVRVAVGDMDGDGIVDVITGAGPGAAGGHVKAFSGRDFSTIASFLPFDPSFTGGVFVGGATGSIAVTPGSSSGAIATIRLFEANASVQWLMPFPSYKGGLTVAQSAGVMGRAPARPKIPGYTLESTW